MNFKRLLSCCVITTLLLSNVLVYAEDDITVPPTTNIPNISEEETPDYSSVVSETDNSGSDNSGSDNSGSDNSGSDSNNTGSTGGGPVGGQTPTADKTDKEDEIAKDKQDAIDDIVFDKPGDQSLEEKKEALKENIDKAVDQIIGDLDQAKDADKQVLALNESLKEVVKNLDEDASKDISKDLSKMVKASMGNPEVSLEEAENLVKDVIEGTFAELAKMDTDVSDDVVEMIDQVLEKASEISMTSSSEEFKTSKTQLTSALEKVKKTKESMVESLEKSGLNDVSKEIKSTLSIKLESKDDEKVLLTLDSESTELLGSEAVDLKVEAKGVNFILPEALLKSAKSGLKVESKPLSETAKNSLTTDTAAGSVKTLKTLDLNVSDGDEDVKGMVELSFEIEEGQDLDSLMVGVFENGKWTKLDYRIEDGHVIFTAPHFSIYSLMAYQPSFEDIDKHWGKTYITSLAAKGIIAGKSDQTFDPNGTITRAEYVTMLVNFLQLDDEVKVNFSDVEADKWYYEAVGRAGIYGLVSGTEDYKFRPNDPIVREDMAVMLSKAYDLKFKKSVQASRETFIDDNLINSVNKTDIYKIRALNIISGYEDNSFRPQGTATRSDAAVTMYLLLNQ